MHLTQRPLVGNGGLGALRVNSCDRASLPTLRSSQPAICVREHVPTMQKGIGRADKPLATREVARAVIRGKGSDESDVTLRKAVAYRFIQNLSRAVVPRRIGDARRRSVVRLRRQERSACN